jgi:hypothetical protein
MADVYRYIRRQLFEHGHVDVCALLHYGNTSDVVHIRDDESIETFADFAQRETAALNGYATSLIHQCTDDVILITTNHAGIVFSEEFDAHSSLVLH